MSNDTAKTFLPALPAVVGVIVAVLVPAFIIYARRMKRSSDYENGNR